MSEDRYNHLYSCSIVEEAAAENFHVVDSVAEKFLGSAAGNAIATEVVEFVGNQGVGTASDKKAEVVGSMNC